MENLSSRHVISRNLLVLVYSLISSFLEPDVLEDLKRDNVVVECYTLSHERATRAFDYT